MYAYALIALLAGCSPDADPTVSTVGVEVDDDGGGARVLGRSRAVVVTGKDYRTRAANAWNEAPDAVLSSGAGELFHDVKSPLLVDVPTRFGGVPADVKVVDLRGETALLDVLAGTDEKAAAEAIRAKGIEQVLLHRSIAASFDRSSQVLSRLYHHDELEHFQLARVDNDALVYLVVDAQLPFPPDVAAPAIQWIRQTLEGKNPPPFPPLPPRRSTWRVLASIRGQGQELAFSLAQGATLDKALIEVANDLELMYRRQREVLGFPRLDLAMPTYTIELHRVTEAAAVVPRDDTTLSQLWEMGLDGAILLDRPSKEERASGKKGQSGAWPGSVAVSRSITRPDVFLKALAREFRWDSVRPWRDDGVELQLIRTKHYVEAPDGGVIEMVRGAAKVPLEDVTLASARASILYAGEWYLANLQDDGRVTYKFWPEDNRWSNEYNLVRHTLATWNLWQAWTLDPRPEFLAGAQKAQDYTLRYVRTRDASSLSGWEKAAVDASPLAEEIRRDGMSYFTYTDNTKLGTVVVGLLGMIEVAKATGDHSNDELMRKLGRFVMFMQEPSGTFRGYHVPEGHSYYGQVNDIVPGEAALSLVYLYEYFDDPRYLEPLPRFFAYYQPWFRTRAATADPEAPWPAYTYKNETRLELVQFGPWTVMATDAYTRVRPEEKEVAAFGLEVARWMIESYEYTSERTPFSDYVGGYYKFEGELPAMQAFCYAEGTAAAYAMALRQAPDQAPFFEQHTREAVRFGMVMQHNQVDSRAFSRAYLVNGGIKYALNEPKVRIDYVHHALSAMYQWVRAAERDPALPAAVKAPLPEDVRRVFAAKGYPGFRAADAPRPHAPPHFAPGEAAEEAEDGE